MRRPYCNRTVCHPEWTGSSFRPSPRRRSGGRAAAARTSRGRYMSTTAAAVSAPPLSPCRMGGRAAALLLRLASCGGFSDPLLPHLKACRVCCTLHADAYRLCPLEAADAGSEACFQRHHLRTVGESLIQWGTDEGTRTPIRTTRACYLASLAPTERETHHRAPKGTSTLALLHATERDHGTTQLILCVPLPYQGTGNPPS